MIESAVAWLFAAMILGGGAMVAMFRHVLRVIIGLGISLFGVAGLFVYLGSPFVAAMQVLIYIGGITVAMVFAMMLSEAMARKGGNDPVKAGLAGAAGLMVFAALAWAVLGTEFPQHSAPVVGSYPVEDIGHGFLTTYNLVFEGLSLILLLAILGAILIAKKDPVKAT